MKSVIEYIDYRKFLKDYYQERKSLEGFSWRDFAQLTGFSSPVYMKLVCEGRYNLSARAVNRISKAMEFSSIEQNYFSLIAKLATVKKEESRQRIFEEIRDILREYGTAALNSSFIKYFDSWKYSVVREVASNLESPTPSKIADLIDPSISPKEVEGALEFLLSNGLLVKDSQGNYKQTKKVLSMVEGFAQPFVSKRVQQDMSCFAMAAMNSLPFEERCITGLTMGITRKNYLRLVAEINNFKRKISSIVLDEKNNAEYVYRMNLHLFPLTKKLK